MNAKAYLLGRHTATQVARMAALASGREPTVIMSDSAKGEGALMVKGGAKGSYAWMQVTSGEHSDRHLFPGEKTAIATTDLAMLPLMRRLVQTTGGLLLTDEAEAEWEVIAAPAHKREDALTAAFSEVSGFLDAHEAGEVLNRMVAGDCEPDALDGLFPAHGQTVLREAVTEAYDAFRNASAPAMGMR